MLIKQLPVVLLFLIKTLEAAVVSLSSLDNLAHEALNSSIIDVSGRLPQTTSKDGIPRSSFNSKNTTRATEERLFPPNWKNNLRAICKTDNAGLAMEIRNDIPPGSALESFDEKLLSLCAEYDAIEIFKSTKFKPIQLEEHFKLLASKGAARLLQLYQFHTKTSHLHLEEFLLPTKLPKDVEGFKFLMGNGYNFLSMKKFVKKFCREGRLDLLKYLQKLNPALIPTLSDLVCAAEKNFKNILDWACYMEIYDDFSDHSIGKALLVNHQFDTLCWWISEHKIPINREAIGIVAEFGAVEDFQWIDNQQLIKCDPQTVVDTTALHRHLPALKWLYKKYGILPTAENLEDATARMLDWIKSKSGALEDPLVAMRLNGIDLRYEDLVKCGAGNFELLQWVFNNAPLSVFDTRKKALSRKVKNMEMMLWLYDKLEICPSEMHWAYKTGNLGAIRWAFGNCSVYPTEWNAYIAAEGGHFHIIEWIYENAYPKDSSCLSIGTLEVSISNGHLQIAEYLVRNVFPKERVEVYTRAFIRADKHLTILEWARKHGFNISHPNQQIIKSARSEDMQVLEWFFVNFPNIEPVSGDWWGSIIERDRHESYRWLLEKYPGVRKPNELIEDVSMAYEYGSLGILKVLHEKDPLVLSMLSQSSITKINYHANQWLTAHGYLVKQS